MSGNEKPPQRHPDIRPVGERPHKDVLGEGEHIPHQKIEVEPSVVLPPSIPHVRQERKKRRKPRKRPTSNTQKEVTVQEPSVPQPERLRLPPLTLEEVPEVPELDKGYSPVARTFLNRMEEEERIALMAELLKRLTLRQVVRKYGFSRAEITDILAKIEEKK